MQRSGALVLCVNEQRPDARDIGGLQRTQHRVLEQASAHPLSLPIPGDGEAGQDHDRHRMAGQPLRQPLGRGLVLHLPDHERVKPHDLVAADGDVALCSPGHLALQGVLGQKPVEGVVAAVEHLYSVASLKFLYPEGPQSLLPSQTLGSCKSRARRGKGLGGASRAARKAAHCSASRPKRWRSASVSCARANALS
jgi:hypothetical protein